MKLYRSINTNKNTCISCLKCNLQKRSRNHNDFKFTKQLIIKKEMILYITKVIDRSYDKIFKFVNDFDNFLLQKKKKISKKSINEFLNLTKFE